MISSMVEDGISVMLVFKANKSFTCKVFGNELIILILPPIDVLFRLGDVFFLNLGEFLLPCREVQISLLSLHLLRLFLPLVFCEFSLYFDFCEVC